MSQAECPSGPMSERTNCMVCFRDVDVSHVAPHDAVHDALRPLLAVNMHRWEPGREICVDCLRRYSRLRDELSAKFPEFTEQEVFFFNETATTEIYTLSLHDAL